MLIKMDSHHSFILKKLIVSIYCLLHKLLTASAKMISEDEKCARCNSLYVLNCVAITAVIGLAITVIGITAHNLTQLPQYSSTKLTINNFDIIYNDGIYHGYISCTNLDIYQCNLEVISDENECYVNRTLYIDYHFGQIVNAYSNINNGSDCLQDSNINPGSKHTSNIAGLSIGCVMLFLILCSLIRHFCIKTNCCRE